MLTESSKDKLKEKLIEIQKLLADQGLASRILIETSNSSGSNPDMIEVDNGFWRSSTAICNGERPDSWYPSDMPYFEGGEMIPTWNSSHNC